jgi:hypothetical protein
MAPTITDEKALRRYLLGTASDAEQEAIDLWLLSEQDAYELLTAAEDDLIDDSLAGRLTGDDLQRFHSHFLIAPERQRKVQFGRAFQRFAGADQRTAGKPSIWNSIAALLSIQPVLGYAVAGLLIIVIAGGGLGVFKLMDVQRQLDSTTAQLAVSRRQLDQSQSQVQALQQQVENLKAAPVHGTEPEALVARVLNPIPTTRSAVEYPKLTLTGNSRIQLSLVLLDSNYETYRAVLQNDGGDPLWTSSPVRATDSKDGKVVVVTPPSELLQNGTYSLKLRGITGGQEESAGSYPFTAIRK